MQVALLNADGQPLQLISEEKAVLLLYKKVAIVCNDHDVAKVFRSISESIVVTKAIRLVKFVKYIYDHSVEVAWSKKGVINRDKAVCQYCGAKDSKTVDHITPRSKGGRNTWLNTVASCKPCNTFKDCKSLRQAGMKLRRQPKKPTLFDVLSGAIHLRG